MIINFDKIDIDMFGNLVVQDEPIITTSKEWLEVMVYEPERRTPMWDKIIESLTKKGIIIES